MSQFNLAFQNEMMQNRVISGNPLVRIDVQVLMSGFNQVTDDGHWQRQPHMFAVQQGCYQVGPADLQVKG